MQGGGDRCGSHWQAQLHALTPEGSPQCPSEPRPALLSSLAHPLSPLLQSAPPSAPHPRASAHLVEGSLPALFTDPGRWGQPGQRRGGCSGVGPPPAGLGAGCCHTGCTRRGSLPLGTPLAASLPAPADFALGRGPGLLATANGSKLIFSGWVFGPSAQPLLGPRQIPSPDSSAHPGRYQGETPSLTSKLQAHIPSTGDSPVSGWAGPGRLVLGQLVWLGEGPASTGHPLTPARSLGPGAPPWGDPRPAGEAVSADGYHRPSDCGLERASQVTASWARRGSGQSATLVPDSWPADRAW